MAIDARIALGVQPVQQQPNMLAQYAQVMGIKAAQQEMEGNNALREAYASGGDLNDPEFRRRVMAANPKVGSQLIKTNAETGKLQNEAVLKRIELSREMLTGVNTPEDYLSWHESNHKDPVLGSYLNQRGVTAEQSRAKIIAALNTPGGLEKLKRESALGAGKLQQELMQTERTRISAGPGYMNANLAQKEFELRQKQQAEIDAISGGGTPTNNLAPPSVNNLVTPPDDVFARIDAIDAQMAKYPINNPRSIPILQALNAQRTQLLASAKQQYGGQITTMEEPDPTTGQPTLIQVRPDQRGVLQPVKKGDVPLSVDATAGSNLTISPNVARPAPSATVIKERQAVAKLPEAIAMNNDAIRKIDEMIGGVDANGKPLPGAKGKPHPGFNEAVGAGFGTAYIPGTQGKSFTIRHKEVLSQAFLDAFEALKGGGAITEKEGEKATAARTRMDLAQSETEYMAAAREYQGVLKRGVENARARIQRSGGTAPTTATPETSAAPVVKTEAEYNALPSGSTYVDPDGVTRRKR
jgi:hypothetical protein